MKTFTKFPTADIIIKMEREEGKFKEVRPGQMVRVYWRLKEDKKGQVGSSQGRQDRQGRTQVFEGLVIARKHGCEPGATITVRAEKSGFGIERIFPIHSPLLEKIEIIKQSKVRRAKLFYLRGKRQ